MDLRHGHHRYLDEKGLMEFKREIEHMTNSLNNTENVVVDDEFLKKEDNDDDIVKEKFSKGKAI